MCKWGNNTDVEVVMPAELSHTGKSRRCVKGIDSCIATIVKSLTDGGVLTTQSCCGHDKAPGRIDLADGRVLIVCRDSQEADRLSAASPDLTSNSTAAGAAEKST